MLATETGVTALCQMDTCQHAASIMDRSVSRYEVVESYLASIKAVIGDECHHVGDEVDALRAADEADHWRAGEAAGRLRGVLFSVKENIDLTVSAAMQLIVALAEAVLESDASHVAHVRAAGTAAIPRTSIMPGIGSEFQPGQVNGQPVRPAVAADPDSGGPKSADQRT